VAENRMNEAMEKLNRGIQESKHEAQRQTMELAQEYFGDSVEALKQQIKDNRATLEGLPEQVPGGQEEAFQGLFQELMVNYARVEESLNEAKKSVADLDPEQIRRQGEVDATDAARRDARELGIDITEVEGTGSDGRVTVDDVKNFAEATKDGAAGEEPKASEAAKRRAEEMGIDLSRIAGTGSGGLITVNDVMSLAEESNDQATGQAGQAAQGVQDTAGQAAQQAQDTAGQVTGQAGQAVQGAQDTVGGLTGGQQQGGGGPLGGVTDQVGQVTQGVQDTAGQATGQAQQAAGQVTDQAGQAAQQAQDTAGQAAQQGQQAAQQAGGGQQGGGQQPNATQAAQQKAEELNVDLSQVQGSGAEGRITVRDVISAANQ
jgi:pyruvate/2-oxoglutarate dehydrogenase complex dihydrolipoamide acyltransferase (E2) component